MIDWRARRKETQKPGRERYSKCAKSLLVAGATDGFFDHEAGFPIEIIPMSDPYRAKHGDNLTVRAVFNGKPAADVQLGLPGPAAGNRRPQSRDERIRPGALRSIWTDPVCGGCTR